MTALAAALLLFINVGGQSTPQAAPAPAAAAADPRAVLELSLRQYDQAVALPNPKSAEAKALFHAALSGFESLVKSGRRNGHLYYNIGNTHMRLGEIGPSIANYLRAERLLPGDPDIRRNLAFARSLCELRIEPKATTAILQTLLLWHYETSPSTRSSVALGAYALFWAVLFVMLFMRRRIPALVAVCVVLGIVSAATGISVAVQSSPGWAERTGVVIAHEAVLRKGNGEAYEPQLDRALTEGVEFRILESRPSGSGETWHHVELADGKDGWLPDRSVSQV